MANPPTNARSPPLFWLRHSLVAVEMQRVATPPRPVFPGQTVFITWRAVNRCFRFVPNAKNTGTLWYAFAYACQKFGVLVHELTILSNHGHLVATFPRGNAPDFMELFGSLAARSLNAIIGINGSTIEKGYSSVAVQDGTRVLEHCAYTLANPCAADLVTRARHWKGVTTAGMRYGESRTIKKPNCGIWTPMDAGSKKSGRRRRRDARCPTRRSRSVLPDTIEFVLVRPDGFPAMSDEELRAEVERRVTEREEGAEARRAEAGKRVMGMKRVKAQFWGAMPGKEDLFGREPTVSASSRWARVEALARRRGFLDAYREARRRWLAGDADVVFPYGTWLLRRRFGVRCQQEFSPMLA